MQCSQTLFLGVMYMVVHAAVTGLPTGLREDATSENVAAWDSARVVQLTWALFDDATRTEVRRVRRVIQPAGFTIAPTATKLHGVSHEHAMSCGIPVSIVLAELMADVATASILVFHNQSFVSNVILSELWRAQLPAAAAQWSAKPKASTMAMCSRIPGSVTQLSVLYERMFGRWPGPWGHGDRDVTACARCYGFLRLPPGAHVSSECAVGEGEEVETATEATATQQVATATEATEE